MAKKIESLSGKVRLAQQGRLDPGRYKYISLDQVEPNLGAPIRSDNSILVSDIDGTRKFVTKISLEKLSFYPGLDSADSDHLFALVIKGNPFDSSTDEVGVRRLSADAFEDDTLNTVTNRGNQTDNPISVGNLTADSGYFNGGLTVSGGLIVNQVSIDSSLSLVGTLFLKDLKDQKTNLILYVDPVTGEVYASSPEGAGDSALGSLTADEIRLDPATGDVEYYATLVTVLSGNDSVRTAQDMTFNPVRSRLTLNNLRLNNLPSFGDTERTFLLINDDNDIGVRTFGELSLLDSEQDTLDTVTSRGDSTDNDIAVGGLKVRGPLTDGSDRQLVILDSAGEILWGV